MRTTERSWISLKLSEFRNWVLISIVLDVLFIGSFMAYKARKDILDYFAEQTDTIIPISIYNGFVTWQTVFVFVILIKILFLCSGLFAIFEEDLFTSAAITADDGECQYSCTIDRDCKDFKTQKEAQKFFQCCNFTNKNDPMDLDGLSSNDNGLACEYYSY